MRKYVYDFLIIGITFFIALILFLFMNNKSTINDSEYVLISIDGITYDNYSLGTNDEIIISNEYGNNTIVINNNSVYIMNADCPDNLCVHQGAINKLGQSIICLPHKLIVEIVSDYDEELIDAIAY